MSSHATLVRPTGGWADYEDDVVPVPSPLDRADAKPSLSRRFSKEIIRGGVIDEMLEDVADLLESTYRFNPEARFGKEDGRVYLWLPELSLDADGDDFDEAAGTLVQEVLTYVEEWEADLYAAPNHARNRGWVTVVQLNRSPARVYRLLFGG